tara:strand:- start:371 stop:2086 length:1716 start_codon:yes stop_codon:yes gene_type:complete
MSGSREAGISLSQTLRTSISSIPETTLKSLKKDTNNLAGPSKKIKESACKKYLNEYKKLMRGEINTISHPATGKPLSRQDRIDFIANQCATAFNLNLNLSGSKSKSNSSGSEEDSPYKNLKTLTFNDIDNILEYPTTKLYTKTKNINSLFTKKTSKSEEILRKYLEDVEIQDENVLLYRKIKAYIKSEFLASYDPFMDVKSFNNAIKNEYEQLVYGGDINDKVLNVLKLSEELFKEAILYSENNKNADDYKERVKENYYKYYSVEFILLALKILYSDTREMMIMQHKLILLDKLIEGTINITDADASKSFDKSRSWSASPEDPILKAQYNTNKKQELERIMNKSNYASSINDSDFYTMDEWVDMPLSKLQNVIVIPYNEGGKVYANAYYIKSLYTAWYLAVKDAKPFLNPANRKPFSNDDKQAILTMIHNLYPGIKEPRYGTQGGRSDIVITYTRDYYYGNNNIKIEIAYLYKNPHNNINYASPIRLPLINIYFPHSFVYANDNDDENETNVSLAYNPAFLFDMINKLMRENKIVGKKIPLKIADPFLSFNTKILNKAEYIRFFDKLKHMI